VDPEIRVRVLDMTIYFLLSLQNEYGSVCDFLCDRRVIVLMIILSGLLFAVLHTSSWLCAILVFGDKC
jgi:membrane protease YdiL (CAAX protease family)